MNNIEQIKQLAVSNPIVVNKGFVGSIYVLINTVNNKWYIGQTYRDYKKRLRNHYNQSCSKNPKQVISRAIKKYGWDKFVYYIIYQTVVSLDIQKVKLELDRHEMMYIQQFHTYKPEYGYNITLGGGGPCGYHFTEEQRQHLSDVKRGVPRPNRCIKIYQYDLDLNLIKIWPSITAIKDHYGIQIEFGDNNFTFFNSVWIKESDVSPETLEKYKTRAEQRKYLSPKASGSKWILQFDFLGNRIGRYPSARYAAQTIQTDESMISGAANGKHKQAKGFIWIYEMDFSDEVLCNKIKACSNSTFYKEFMKKHQIE